jgi:hypothetical protein
MKPMIGTRKTMARKAAAGATRSAARNDLARPERLTAARRLGSAAQAMDMSGP